MATFENGQRLTMNAFYGKIKSQTADRKGPRGTTQLQTSPGKNTLEGQLWPEALKNFLNPCNPKKLGPNVPSKSVHSLRPSDIKLVAAIGNLDTPIDSEVVSPEKPERSEKTLWQTCMPMVTVLSDIIRHFNPAVLLPVCPPGKGVAPHHGAEDLWIQAEELVRSLKENQQLDFQHDWKLINVFFSNASRCYLCPSIQQERHVKNDMERLARTLDYLQEEVPKAFVNLVDLSEIAAVSHWHQGAGLSDPVPEPCHCPEKTSKLDKVIMQWSYQEAWESLLASSRFSDQESFAVVFQPFFYEMLLPSEKPLPHHPAVLALSLWNNMMEPAGRKDEPFHAAERKPMKCPSQENPYLFTYKNSNYQSRFLQPHGQSEVREGTEIRCPDKDPSDMIPTSVHRLKPADIKVIGALGDSLTAGNGAGSRVGAILDVLTQYRGLSWSCGGDQNISTVTTLANILREFNPSLKGFSVGTGKETTSGAFLNQAVAGAKSEDLAVQARRLVDLMKNDTRIHFQEDWKIITLFIGGNDLCDSCTDPVHHSPQNFTANIRKALDILHAEVPRAFVNLVKALEIINLRELYLENKVSCPRLILRSLCPCVLKFDDNSTELASLVEINRKYQEGTHELIESGRYDTRDDFTVVVQPFFEKVEMPKTSEGLPDSSFFAPDCFHFSSKAHARAASALWKNMLQPVGQKTTRHNFEDKVNVMCPNQVWPYLSTYKNNMEGLGTWLPCRDRKPSASPPASVHALRPADIQVVAALGDTLTAGNGIGSKPDDLTDVTTQYRGLSYSSGGDGSLENVTTLPNILREFNRNLIGYAVGTGDADADNAFFNQAVPGAKAEELVRQVQSLVQRIKDDHRVNFHEDWKVITVMIGASDLCDHCTDSNLYSAANFFDHLRNALDILHTEVPRALVNLVDFMDPIVMRQVFLGNPDQCPVKQASLLCNCVLSLRDNSQELGRLEAFTRAYKDSMRELIESGRYDTREDFSVVLQPFFLNIQLPTLEDGRPDISFFAPDCIHPNQKFHSQLSRALWANMLEPLGRKTDTLDLTADIPLACPTQEEPFLRTLKNSNYTYPTKPAAENWGSDFLCTEWTPSPGVPTTVHKLRPADIKVVAALGDSLTTAVGARPGNSSHLLTSWRGLSWSIGGDGALETHTTLPNILKKFNPSILGFSTGVWAETAGLNVAVEGARARDMPDQGRDLVERMKQSPEIDLEKDWKLVTLFIGGSDLCHFCENPEDHSAEKYFLHIQQALDILYKELPRAFVNVVEVMDLAGLHQGHGGKCAMPLMAQSNCSCLKHFQNSLAMQELKKVNWNLQSGMSRFSYLHQYTQREDFAVVVQPFFRNTLVPLNERGNMDLTFFSEDCVHLSERGHAEMAIALWNNMLEPVGQKTTSNNFTYSRAKLKCPSPDSPFFYTLRNSGLLPDQSEAFNGLYWALPTVAIGGLVLGILTVTVWKRIRQRENSPTGQSTARF
ncbi:phospholipase B1, membrane-associated [Dipodomys spectabilis]|uniref:phospholipase B1, membrane-associated n=1 Tax=Dipodomys spectabilis TaxID=105255 RepID=UPI001C5381A6|nr:phospholipase B1, membrane-associated [Dipodomys spectabilis]